MQAHIRQFALRYQARGDHSDRPKWRAFVRAKWQPTFVRGFEAGLDEHFRESGEVIFVRKLHLKLKKRSRHEPLQAGRELAALLAAQVERPATEVEVVRFASWPAFLAEFLSRRLRGLDCDSWEFRPLDRYRLLSSADVVREVVAEYAAHAADVIPILARRLAESASLESLAKSPDSESAIQSMQGSASHFDAIVGQLLATSSAQRQAALKQLSRRMRLGSESDGRIAPEPAAFNAKADAEASAKAASASARIDPIADETEDHQLAEAARQQLIASWLPLVRIVRKIVTATECWASGPIAESSLAEWIVADSLEPPNWASQAGLSRALAAMFRSLDERRALQTPAIASAAFGARLREELRSVEWLDADAACLAICEALNLPATEIAPADTTPLRPDPLCTAAESLLSCLSLSHTELERMGQWLRRQSSRMARETDWTSRRTLAEALWKLLSQAADRCGVTLAVAAETQPRWIAALELLDWLDHEWLRESWEQFSRQESPAIVPSDQCPSSPQIQKQNEAANQTSLLISSSTSPAEHRVDSVATAVPVATPQRASSPAPRAPRRTADSTKQARAFTGLQSAAQPSVRYDDIDCAPFLLARAILDVGWHRFAEKAVIGDDHRDETLRFMLAALSESFNGRGSESAETLAISDSLFAGFDASPSWERGSELLRTAVDWPRLQLAIARRLHGQRQIATSRWSLLELDTPGRESFFVGGDVERGVWPFVAPLVKDFQHRCDPFAHWREFDDAAPTALEYAARTESEWRTVATGQTPASASSITPDAARAKLTAELSALASRSHGDALLEARLALHAGLLVRTRARWLGRMADASAGYLLANAFRRKGSLIVDSREITVLLRPAPLDVLLKVAGLLQPIDGVPWLAGRRIQFQVEV